MFKYLLEFLGTFIFLSVILASGQALPIAMGLAVVIYLFGSFTGGHFNPAVSTMMYLGEQMTMNDWVGYVVAQIAGGAAALYFFRYAQAAAAME